MKLYNYFVLDAEVGGKVIHRFIVRAPLLSDWMSPRAEVYTAAVGRWAYYNTQGHKAKRYRDLTRGQVEGIAKQMALREFRRAHNKAVAISNARRLAARGKR